MRRKRRLLIPLVLMLAVLISGCGQQQAQEKKDTIVIGRKSDTLGFAPFNAYESPTMSLNSNIFNALIEFDGKYVVVPALAKTWSNPDDSTWRFNLRKDVKFHNGDDFTARDVKYTYERTRADKGSEFKDLLTSVTEIIVVDDYILDIKTDGPFPVLLNKLVDIWIVSEKYQKGNPGKNKPMGTGPYKLKEYVKDDHITLERFDEHWGGAPKIKNAIFKVILDNEKRVDAFLNKQVDIVEFIPSERIDEVRADTDSDALPVETIRVMYLAFDLRENGSYAFPDGQNPTADLRVRKAIYHAIDEHKIVREIMGGLAVPVSQFIGPAIFGYNPKIKRLPYDLTKARQLMREAGYENGFEITLDCPNNRYVNDEEICIDIGRQLADINIKVTVSAIPKADFFPKVTAHDSSLFFAGWAASTGEGGDIFDYILMTQDNEKKVGTKNRGSYSNAEVDRLGTLASQVIDPERRLRILQQGFKIATDDIVWVPLHLQTVIYGKSKDIVWKPRIDTQLEVEEIHFK